MDCRIGCAACCIAPSISSPIPGPRASRRACIVARGAHGERAPQLAAKIPDHVPWIGFLKDPDGNLVGPLEEKR